MRLVEKKCPNCGAGLEFGENDKTCKCQYCKNSFEIERDSDNLENFVLSARTITKSFNIIFLIPIIFFIVIAFTIFVNTKNSIKRNSNFIDNSETNDKTGTETKNSEKLISDVNELTNQDFETINWKNYSIVNQSVVGGTDSKHAYHKTGDPRLIKTIVAYKEKSNYLISIYEVNYYNFFNEKEKFKVYVPVVFNTVTNKTSYSLANGKNPAPKYYFNKKKTNYIYAYKSYKAAYNDVVKPLEADYKVTQK